MNGNQLSKDCREGSGQQEKTQWLSLLSHKMTLKRGDQSCPTAYGNTTASKAPRRDPGSLESSLEATANKGMRTPGQPATEEKHHLRFNCWGQGEKKRKKAEGQELGGVSGLEAGGISCALSAEPLMQC